MATNATDPTAPTPREASLIKGITAGIAEQFRRELKEELRPLRERIAELERVASAKGEPIAALATLRKGLNNVRR